MHLFFKINLLTKKNIFISANPFTNQAYPKDNMFLKNIFSFYILIALPLASLILAAKYNYINSNIFVLLLFVYCLIYHPFISGLRLLQSKKINKQDFWKNFIPFWNDKYWMFLFFNK